MLTKKPLLLLVEDSNDDAFFFGRAFAKAGLDCEMQRVSDGAEAVEFIQKAAAESQPLVIFLDLKMPILNGFEVLEWMGAQTFPVPMQVIVLSGSDHEADKARAARLGAMDYVVKPMKVLDLYRFLRDVCPSVMGEQV